MKWFILLCALGSDILLLVAIYFIFSANLLLGILLIVPVYGIWIRSFLRNWDRIMSLLEKN